MRTHKPKTFLVVSFMAVCLLGTAAMAQVYTDPVGFVKSDIVRDGLTMVSVPLQAADTRLNGDPGCVGDMIKENLNGGASPAAADVIWKWDAATQSYEQAFLVYAPGTTFDNTWFNPTAGAPSTATFSAGEAMWIDRKSAGDPVEQITFLGWVPMEGTRSLTFVKGLNMFAYPFPVTMLINDTDLAGSANGGPSSAAADVVWEWDGAAGSYKSAFLVAAPGSPFDGKWFDQTAGAESDITFGPGAAFWFERKPDDPATWAVTRPY